MNKKKLFVPLRHFLYVREILQLSLPMDHPLHSLYTLFCFEISNNTEHNPDIYQGAMSKENTICQIHSKIVTWSGRKTDEKQCILVKKIVYILYSLKYFDHRLKYHCD